MKCITAQTLSHRRNHLGRRARANRLHRLSAAVEPLERRLLLTSVVVNTTADVTDAPGSAVISLRDAINIANKSTTPTAISFTPMVFATAKTIGLDGHDLELSATQPVTITGPAAGVTVNGKNSSADFVIDKGVTCTISSLTVSGGYNYFNGENGGGIENNGTLTLKNTIITGNFAYDDGGGIANFGALTIYNSTVANNSAGGGDYSDGAGGGIANEAGAVITITNVTVSGNIASFSGGLTNLGTATLTGSTFSNNRAIGGGGPGGVYPGSCGGIGNFGKMTLTNCTVSGNFAGADGGGLYNGGALTLADTTISGNTAGGEYSPAGVGGGLDSYTATVIQNSIVSGNQVVGGQASDGTAVSGTGPDVSGAVRSSGYNLIGQTNGSTGWKPTDLTGTSAHPLNALLSPLGSFGGPTRTLLPTTGSPAIDHGSNALIPAGITTDQRGLPRIVNHTVDIGAVEVQPATAHIVVTARANLTATEGSSYSLSPGSFTETGAVGPYTVDVNWGDGTPDSVYPVAAPGALPRTAHIFAEEGTYHGLVTVYDGTGQISAPTPFSVKVADAPLSGSAAALSGVAPGVPFAWQAATFIDANPNGMVSDFSATINWGDGTSSTAVVAAAYSSDGNGFGVTGTHTYAKAGTYTFVVTVKDVGGATVAASSTITCINAKSIVVNTTKDQTDPAGSKTISLRDAVDLADMSTVPISVSFDPTVFAGAKTITLTGSSLDLSRATTSIVGPAAGVTISAGNQSDVFDIASGVIAGFSGLSIAGGASGISNEGVLSLTNCSVVRTKGSGDGGIYNSGGYMVLTGDTISGTAGGIFNNAGTISLIDCTVADNTAGFDGGGIENNDTMFLYDCTVANNTAASGGGIYNDGTLVIANSIIAGNSAGSSPDVAGSFDSLGFNLVGKTDASSGWTSTDLTGTAAKPLSARVGPLANNGGPTQTLLPLSGSPAINHGSNGGIGNYGTITLTDCTVFGNSSGGPGGGVANYATLTLLDSTVSGNTAPFLGGGLYAPGSSTVIQNSIIAGNASTDNSGPDVFGAVHSNGYNLIGKTNDSSGWTSTDLTGTIAKPLNAKLGPLANNGGFTQTLLPLAGSPAINAGNPNYNPTVSGLTDQRGYPRLTDGNISGAISRLDIGAVEVAGNIVVTSKVDDATGSNFTAGDLSLRDAIVMANPSAGANKIIFAPAVRGTITLNGNPLTPASNETISGPGAGSLTLSGAGRSQVFRVTLGNVTVSGITLSGGSGGSGGGGAVYNRAKLTLTNDTITASSACQGGGIYNAGTAVVTDCTVSGNSAASDGGGIFQVPNILGSGPATLTLNACTVSGNSAATAGGGIFNSAGASTVNVFNSTLAANKSSAGTGGAVDNAGTLAFTNATVSGNTAKTGGGLANTGSATADNTILSANTSGDVFGNLALASAYNLIGTGGGLTNGKNGNLVGITNPLLGPLANNGGPTLTMTLLAGSKAINAGSNALAVGPDGKPLPTDQRGDPRIVGGRVDIGAVEV